MKINRTVLACSFPVLNMLMDIIVMHAGGEESQFFQYSRALLTITIIGLLLSQRIKFNLATTPVVIFFFYIFLLIIFRGIPEDEFLIGIRWLNKLIVSMLLIFVGYSYINTEDKLHVLNKNLIYAGFIFVFYVIASNIFGFGTNLYLNEEDLIEDTGLIKTGNLGGVAMNTASIILLLSPIIFHVSFERIKRKSIVLIMLILLFIILILVLRRSAIIIVVIGYIIYFFVPNLISKRNKKIIYLVFGLFIITSPFYVGNILSSINLRGDKAISADAIGNDTRSREIPFVLNSFKNSNDTSYILFGESFTTKNFFIFASFGRSLHSDLSNLLYITGITGFFLYLLIHFNILIFAWNYRKYSKPIYFVTVLVLILTSLLLIFPGRFTAITYRSLMFIYLGALLGNIYYTYKISKQIEKYSYSN